MLRRESLWSATVDKPLGRTLGQDLRVEVAIIGAGIAGLTTAYLLARTGKSVAVLDDGPVGGGMTQRTSAHLTNALDDRYYELERLHGTEAARLAGESHGAAIDFIERITAQERIDCNFARVDGYLFLAEGDRQETLDKELSAALRAGLSTTTALREPPLPFSAGPSLCFPRQGRFHPLKYLTGLARAIERDGGRIFTAAHARALQPGNPVRVQVGAHAVSADAVVVATNVPINDRLAIHTKQAPYMTYVIGLGIPRGSVPDVLAWDTGDPYHYIRIAALEEHDVLIVGGEDHKSGQAQDTAERHARLEAWARARFPMAGAVEFAWGGQVMEPIDFLSFSGRNPGDGDNVYVHTGDSGMGLTHGTIGGMLISDLILGRENPWAKLYDPSRKPIKAAGAFMTENLNVAKQYADWLAGGEVTCAEEIAPDSGALLRRGLKKVAVYRDAQGILHERSAACPHLGCPVHWNKAEKTWDCPCHGSRFGPTGRVINGPANRDLAAVGSEQDARAA